MNKYIIPSLMLLGCSLHAVESRIEIRHREAGGVGYSKGYSSLDYFLMTEGDVEFLLDLRGHVFNNGQGAGNAGVGFRCPVKDDKYLIGANAFYDIRQSTDLLCNQVGAGFEWLTKNVDFRINGYLPVGKKQVLETKTFEQFAGQAGLIQRKLRSTLPSIDGEVGTPLPKPFYFAVGAYYLFKQSQSSLEVGNALGARVRAEVDLGRYFTLGFALTYDRIFKTRPQGYISINIPFEKKKCLKPTKQEKCPISKDRNLRRVPIMRNEIIPVQDKKRSKDPILGDDDNPVRFMFVDNMADLQGDGSFESPFASLKDAENNSVPGDVIYVFPGDNTARNMDQGIVLKDDQILASSGAPLIINGVIIPPQTPGIAPQLTNLNHPYEPYITNPGNTHLDDFFFIPPWEYIFGRGIDIDPFAEARAEGFEIIQPEQAPPPPAVDLGALAIIDNYQVPPPAAVENAGTMLNPFQIVEDYGN